ncbi:hypothetical protein D3C85_1128010 [compost metagenome]
MRRFANGQRQLGGGGGGAGGVGTGVFSSQAQRLAGNGGRAQLQARRAAGNQRHAVAVDLERNAGALEHLGQGRGRLQRAGHGAGLDAGHLVRAVEDLQIGLHAQLGQRAGQRLHGDTHFYRRCVGHVAPQQRGGQQNAGQQGPMQRRALYGQRERCAAWKRSHYLPVLLKKCRAEFLLIGMIIKTGRECETGKEM